MVVNPYRKLTRGDIRTFDDRATAMVLRAMELGAVGRVSSRGGHSVIIRTPNGQTVSISRQMKSGNRGFQNAVASLRRAFPNWDAAPAESNGNGNGNGRSHMPTESKSTGDLPEPHLSCPAKRCDAVFVTEGARYSHIEKEHWKCPEPGCGFVGKDKERSAAPHHSIVHLGQKPWEARSAAAAARREAKEAKPEAPAVVEAKHHPGAFVTPFEPEPQPEARTAEHTLQIIRGVLGDDPRVEQLQARVAELEVELKESRKHAGELEAKLQLMKEVMSE